MNQALRRRYAHIQIPYPDAQQGQILPDQLGNPCTELQM
jgi:hypothetical protein